MQEEEGRTRCPFLPVARVDLKKYFQYTSTNKVTRIDIKSIPVTRIDIKSMCQPWSATGLLSPSINSMLIVALVNSSVSLMWKNLSMLPHLIYVLCFQVTTILAPCVEEVLVQSGRDILICAVEGEV